MKGLGSYTPHCSAVASLVVALDQTIRQAVNGINLSHNKKQKLSPCLQSIFWDWKHPAPYLHCIQKIDSSSSLPPPAPRHCHHN
eukprot:2607802-Ditylum_brightwellii.AAC.2